MRKRENLHVQPEAFENGEDNHSRRKYLALNTGAAGDMEGLRKRRNEEAKKVVEIQ